LISAPIVDLTPYWFYRIFVDISSFNFYIGQREAHTLPEHIRYQTALDFTRASSGIYNIVHTLPYLISNLPRIHQPTLLIWGKRDQTLSPDSFPRLETLLPNIITSLAMPLCGHVPHQCHPDEINPYVLKFLKSYALSKA
jgi:pimeloyl-ACP methyl ester carboxylesterase